jgi:MFS family permease
MIFFQHESTLPIFITDLHFPLSYFGWLLTINTLLIVFCELPLNIATMQWSYRTNFVLGSIFVTLGFAGMYFVSQAWHLAILAACWTIGEMILFPAANSYIAEISPVETRGSYMALFNTSYNLGLLLGPLGGAFIMQHLGASGLWIACGFWGMLSIVGFYFLKIREVKENLF